MAPFPQLVLLLSLFGTVAFAADRPIVVEDLGGLTGIQTDEMRDRGWYQNDAPKVFQKPTLFAAQTVAASSRACAELSDENGVAWVNLNLRESQKQCEAQGGYQNVHLYVSIAHDISDDMAQAASQEDPWFKNKQLRSRVLFVKSEQRADIRKAVLNLLQDCKVASFIYVSSHGNSGSIAWGKGGALGVEPVGYFLQRAFSPCMLAPGARVQFDGCDMACGQGAEQIRHQLDRALDARAYRTDDAKFTANDPFEGVEFYANTALGYNWVPSRFVHFFGFKARAWSENDLGVVFQRAAGMMTTDVPTDKVPGCVAHGGRRGD